MLRRCLMSCLTYVNRPSVRLRPYRHGPAMARRTGQSARCPRHVAATRISRCATARI